MEAISSFKLVICFNNSSLSSTLRSKGGVGGGEEGEGGRRERGCREGVQGGGGGKGEGKREGDGREGGREAHA